MNFIERIARVIAGHRLSTNAEGSLESAGSAVDAEWSAHRDEALEILKSLRDPPQDVLDQNGGAQWQTTIDREIRLGEGVTE